MSELRQSLIDDLEAAIATKSIGDRATMLRRVTDLFLMSSGQLDDEKLGVFDTVMTRLLDELESSARATFGHILATVPDAPPATVRALASDFDIEVAGPLLTFSERLNDRTLVELASTGGQKHLLAISKRRQLAEPVTDILVTKGDHEVAISTVRNRGAAFSEQGYATLVARSTNDPDLARGIWLRPEIPRQHLLTLFAQASETVRRQLTHEDPSKAGVILEIVAKASQQIRDHSRRHSPRFADAYASVQSLYFANALGETELVGYAGSDKFEETLAALSLMCDLPIDLVERTFIEERSEQLIVMAKASGLSWGTVKALLRSKARLYSRPVQDFEKSLETFNRLNPDTARKAIGFYRLRQRSLKAAATHH